MWFYWKKKTQKNCSAITLLFMGKKYEVCLENKLQFWISLSEGHGLGISPEEKI